MTKKKPTEPEPDWDDALKSLVDQLRPEADQADPTDPVDPAGSASPLDRPDDAATPRPAPTPEPGPPSPEELLAERTADLQRLQAEYVNYKKRVDRDRDRARQLGVEAVLGDLLPVLDGIEAARGHDELNGGARLLADELAKVTAKYGLEPYGQVGDPFDPHVHEALMNLDRPGYAVTSVAQVFQLGYRLDGRVLRPARVAVADPTEPAPEPTVPAAADPAAAPVADLAGPGDTAAAAEPGPSSSDSAASPSSAATLNSPSSPAGPAGPDGGGPVV
ncbi:MAG: nucleotide exchange factor GrpE [Propionibacteriaceae bacterium]|jgi:molecular chaperone GrpE|nr:nucleotide exchange factor GrpE [Propionibacteriaceae bacterium]